jgi:hypothetical protein
MTNKELVLDQVKFLRANCLGQLLDAVEQDFWLKVNDAFIEDLKSNEANFWWPNADKDGQ